jgi:hypothetical protein
MSAPGTAPTATVARLAATPLRPNVTSPEPLLIKYPATMTPAVLPNPFSSGTAATLCRS